MRGPWLVLWGIASSCLFAPACVCAGQAAGRPTLGAHGCAIASEASAPLVVEWNGAARGQLEALRAKHVVAVHYTGCEMEVLPACTVKTGYTYVPLTPKRDRVRVKDETELYANIPLHAASLAAKLQSAGELDVTMNIVGRFDAETTTVGSDALEGDCARATHVIVGLTTGAFQFLAGAASVVGGGVNVGGIGGGTQNASQSEVLNQDGDDKACAKATSGDKAPPFGCGAVIRIELATIGGTRPAQPTCPDGTAWQGSQCVSTQPPGPVPNPDPNPPPNPGPPPCPHGTHHEGAGCAPDADGIGAMLRIPGAWYRWQERDPAIQVATFDLDVTPVTLAQFKACVDAGRCVPPRAGGDCNWGKDGRARHPINCVSWPEAKNYCEWAAKRLPTDYEWEYAAIGQTAWQHPWGNADIDATRACRVNDNTMVTCPVGSFPAGQSRFGILDMGGPFREMLLDGWCAGSTPPSSCDGHRRASRSGFSTVANDRGYLYLDAAEPGLGFRCARTVSPSPGPRACPDGTVFTRDGCIPVGGTCPPGLHQRDGWACVPDGTP